MVVAPRKRGRNTSTARGGGTPTATSGRPWPRMPAMRRSFGVTSVLCLALVAACGGDDVSDDGGGASLDDFLPELPEPTGEAPSVFAGVIGADDESELVPGPASSGLPGDYFLRNARGRFVIEAPTRVLGQLPYGGNLVDAVPVGADGGDLAPDHFGEISFIYRLGRTCEHTSVEVVQDGSGGGAAVIRARGVAVSDDALNIRGVGLLPLDRDLIPDYPDGVECATTYVLEPDSPVLHVRWTLFNGGEDPLEGPFGALSDTGGDVGVWTPGIGFGRQASITDVINGANAGASRYAVYQGPGVAYGVVPRHEDPETPNASVSVLGISIFAYGATEFLDIINPDKNGFLAIPPQGGRTVDADIVVGLDAADVERAYRELVGDTTEELGGTVLWDDGEPVAGARVAIFGDAGGDGAVAEDDAVISYADTDGDGRFVAALPPGSYLLRADIEETARSIVVPAATGDQDVALELLRPVRYDYRIVDLDGGDFLPARLVVIGDSPVRSDPRLHTQYDRPGRVVRVITAIRGTSTDLGDGADPALELAPGADYRLYAMRGTEWSTTSVKLSPTAGEQPAELELPLRRVVDTSGYLATEYHVHSINSPDSPIQQPARVRSAAADGVELFAATDHDFVTDLQPVVEMLGLERVLRVLPGIETSPMVYGHFNAWPVTPDGSSANGGAIDWPVGAGGFAMIPGEIFAEARARGAEVVQVNHPRRGPQGSSDITEHFDRMGLTFDYESRSIAGDPDKMPVPIDWLRLPPDMPLFDLGFNALEVWSSFGVADTNGDGVRELTKLDVVMRDWFNFLSFGKPITPIGNSDTHTVWKDPMGFPRTLVRVDDDSADALESGAVVDALLDTLAGRSEAPIDIVLSNGPHLQVEVDGDPRPLGRILDGTDGEVDITITAMAPEWAEFETIELFSNATPESDAGATALQPLACFTSRVDLDPADPCAQAPIQGNLSVARVDLGDGTARWEASVSLTVAAEQIVTRAGATGADAWFVARVQGHERPIFPLLLGGTLTGATLPVLVDEPGVAEREAALRGKGVPAAAITSAFYVDFDGGGYTAPFAPN